MAKRKVVNPNNATYLLHKVEYNGKRTIITYDFNGDGKQAEKIRLSSGGQPKEGFIRAMAELKPYAMLSADIPKDYSGGISCISVAWTKKGVRFAIAKILKSMGTTIISPPWVKLFDRDAKKQADALPEEANDALATLRMAAIDYIKGERGAGPLFEKDEEKEKEFEPGGETAGEEADDEDDDFTDDEDEEEDEA